MTCSANHGLFFQPRPVQPRPVQPWPVLPIMTCSANHALFFQPLPVLPTITCSAKHGLNKMAWIPGDGIHGWTNTMLWSTNKGCKDGVCQQGQQWRHNRRLMLTSPGGQETTIKQHRGRNPVQEGASRSRDRSTGPSNDGKGRQVTG